MVELTDVKPLLDAIGKQADPRVRLRMLDALTLQDLSDDAWRQLGPIAASLLKRLNGDGAFDAAARAVFARIPLRSIRERLRRMAADTEKEGALPMALALATAHDLEVLPTLQRAWQQAPTEAVACALAALPLENTDLRSGAIASGLIYGQREARLWAAIAMGRVQDYEPIEQLWDVAVRPREERTVSVESPWFTATPVFFRATVGEATAQLQALGPQPPGLRDYVGGLMHHELGRAEAGPAFRGRRRSNARVLVNGLSLDPDSTGLVGRATLIDDGAFRDATMISRAKAKVEVLAPPTSVELFPRIDADEAHPLAGSSVAFEVSLGTQPSAGTAGKVRLPDDDDPAAVHALQVHLMFGDASAWSELTFSHAGGTLQPARFRLPAPAVVNEAEGVVAVRANFYLGQRWCGEAVRNLDVRRDASTPSLGSTPAPKLPDWHGGIRLEAGAQPPDLIVRILRDGAAGSYCWTCLSPHLALVPPSDPADARMALGSDAETFVKSLLKPLADKWLDALSQAGVDGAGDLIYAATPAVFKRAYWAVWEAARAGGFEFESIQLVTDEPYVPWELMRVADDDIAPDEPPVCLSIRHSVGRWLSKNSNELTQRIAVQSVAVSASDYAQIASVAQKLPWARHERAMLLDEYHAVDVPLRSAELLTFLNEGRVQAVHFACHGKMSISAPDTSFLVLEDTPQLLQPPVIGRVETRRGLGRQRPLVFLNACEVGGAASSLDIVAGFPAAFLSAGAAAVVCPLWAVNDERAQRIAEMFYERVLVADGAPLGRVLRDVRAAWRAEGQLTYLAYVLYGDPMARVIYTGPPRVRRAPAPTPVQEQ